jgi:hypothetical protein
MSEVREIPVDLGDAPVVDDEAAGASGEFDDAEVLLDAEPGAAPQPLFNNVEEWVEQWALPHWRRNIKSYQWDPRWWEYTEALTVLESLWRAWEQMRLDGLTGMAVYMRDFFYPLMNTLTAADGAFWKVNDVQVREMPARWPSEPAPEGMFDPHADSAVKE